jgi:hypothetical protein
MIERITTTNDIPSGIMSEGLISRMREINLNPTFNKKEKPWSLVKVPKSTTKNVAWHIRINEENIMATHVPTPSSHVIFYPCSPKAVITAWGKPLASYGKYADLEAAVDKFYEENYNTPNDETNEIQQSETI